VTFFLNDGDFNIVIRSDPAHEIFAAYPITVAGNGNTTVELIPRTVTVPPDLGYARISATAIDIQGKPSVGVVLTVDLVMVGSGEVDDMIVVGTAAQAKTDESGYVFVDVLKSAQIQQHSPTGFTTQYRVRFNGMEFTQAIDDDITDIGVMYPLP